MTTPSERERAELRIELERVWCSVKTGDKMIDAFTDYVLVQCEAARREERKRCAEICQAVYQEHKRSKSYPMDMGGLALEIKEKISALDKETA